MLVKTIDAKTVRKCFLAGANALDRQKDVVNELNVFPVPDGDTGTNMTMTIMSAAREVADLDEKADMKAVCKAISGGSLKGARGNSGVILSQLLRGFTKIIQNEKKVNVHTLQVAFERAVEQAYKAVMKPKEGTILTVARAGAEKAYELDGNTDNILEMCNAVILHMEDVLEQTPDMLPVLKDAGVVDSGGQGLLYFLQGCLDVLMGKDVDTDIFVPSHVSAEEQTARRAAADMDVVAAADIKFGYCTEFIILLEREFTHEDELDFKSYLTSIGDSLVCVADDEVVKIHVHTNDPGLAIQRALEFGSLTRMKIDNMREEHHERVIKNSEQKAAEEKLKDRDELSKREAKEEQSKPKHKTDAFISISAGIGISDIFTDLGVDVLIEGGQTMNPSTEDILSAVDRIDADHIFVLPNNSNILLAANQAAELAKDKEVYVVNTKNIPEGVAAMLGFIEGNDPKDNLESMNEAASAIKEGEVTYAVRDTQIDGKEIHNGDIMGICGKKIEALGEDITDTTVELIKAMLDEDSELVTLYYGEDLTEEDAAKVASKVGLERLDVDFEIHNGGQPIYYYFISVE
ncbi:MAG: DAK2 domain-containing protein [Eubacterium sp.]|nr:DAK2 domain-containing protein [Eubacterium sp.]